MLYTVTIVPSDGKNIIEFGKTMDGDKDEKQIITEVNISFDTTDDDVRQKSNSMLAKLKICGEIKPEITDKLIAVFNWTRDPNQDQWYRTVEIEIKSSENNVVRSYKFEKMFVVDYIEHYEKEDKKCTFELELTQKENYLDNINTASC
ncbi:hypothetical protein [Megasphaera stantonii]|uniref:Phage tail protein n=1 Tax=Megasphaera stantonii TaxID=2144175 RepID=A0A346AXZ7_9FIRM|nr:hypothetical protein [Megasphaera stantonii]AXL20740.1 hypothetical protein DKB62_03690 [Megasphaera stantonii]